LLLLLFTDHTSRRHSHLLAPLHRVAFLAQVRWCCFITTLRLLLLLLSDGRQCSQQLAVERLGS
jgi:hypothetical protein